MPMWRCPHCGTPQAETARCWVCRRSSTTCSTCRNYRRAVTPRVGWCGLDRKRALLRGDEMRGCWDGGVAVGPGTGGPRVATAPTGARTFIPVTDLTPPPPVQAAPVDPLAPELRPPADGWTDRRTLFGEAEA